MEVAVCSKFCFDAILVTFEKLFEIKYVVFIVALVALLLLEIKCCPPNLQIGLLLDKIFFVILSCV